MPVKTVLCRVSNFIPCSCYLNNVNQLLLHNKAGVSNYSVHSFFWGGGGVGGLGRGFNYQ